MVSFPSGESCDVRVLVVLMKRLRYVDGAHKTRAQAAAERTCTRRAAVSLLLASGASASTRCA